MKAMLSTALIMLGTLVTHNAVANDDVYVGALYNQQDLDVSNRDYSAAGFLIGYEFNQYVAFESRFATGTSGMSGRYATSELVRSYKEDIDLQTSLLLKLSYPIADGFNVYGVAGYTRTKINFENERWEVNEAGVMVEDYHHNSNWTRGGFSYGAGLEYQVNDKLSVFVDHQILPDFESLVTVDQDWSSTTVGLTYRF
ncbi:porin family protein [Pseudoalteromonas sp. MMG022]|uniref:porin family protein n=1 Tax=Pseudoalteromonas sp. MMG022 TaxID=2909978 RepID=UPI001F1C8255|nr:porin family protein [Pseudoalteromonas sp. MMG022]MCF6436903.1 porin family protein [Pseudoalteromonas sp. MMG022]